MKIIDLRNSTIYLTTPEAIYEAASKGDLTYGNEKIVFSYERGRLFCEDGPLDISKQWFAEFDDATAVEFTLLFGE